MSDALTQAEQTANRIREELLRTVEELQRRRERITDVRFQARQFAPVLWGVAGVVGVLAVGRLAFALYERHKWGSRKQHQRVKAAERAWRHPEQVARASKRGAPTALLLAVAVAFGKTLAAQLARRTAVAVFEARQPRPVLR